MCNEGTATALQLVRFYLNCWRWCLSDVCASFSLAGWWGASYCEGWKMSWCPRVRLWDSIGHFRTGLEFLTSVVNFARFPNSKAFSVILLSHGHY